MKKVKRVFALLLAVCVLAGVMMVLPFSAAAEGSDSNICVIAKFDNEEAIQTAVSRNPVRLTSGGLEETWNGTTALKMVLGTGEGLVLSSPEADWSQYQWFRMRFYASRAGMQFNIIPTTYDKGNIDANPYFRRTWTVASEGWQEIAVPIKTDGNIGFGANKKAVNGVDTEPSWSTIQGMYLNTGGWSIEQMHASDVLYFDEVWLEKEKTFTVTGSGEQLEGKVLLDVNSDAVIDQTPCKTDFLSLAGTREGGNSGYAAILIPSTSTNVDWMFYEDKTNPIDLSNAENRYLNMWIYSPQASNGGLQVICTDSNGRYGLNPIGAVNWKGWKLVSMDLSKFKATGGGTAPVFDPAKVVSVRFNAQGWQDGKGNGQHTPVWKSNGYVGLEKAWLSSAPAVDLTEPVLPQSAEKVNLPAGNFLLKDFCAADGETMYSAKWEGQVEYWQANGRNGKVYDMSARMEWNKIVKNTSGDGKVTYSMPVNPGSATRYLFDTDDAGAKIPTGDYHYWNTWVYSPGIKTDADKNQSKLIFNINTGSAADQVDKKNHPSFVTVDWSGWKLVSIPLDTALGADQGFGAHEIAIAANEWLTDGKYVGWYDIGNYIDVERSWLSVEEPAVSYAVAENGLSVTDGAVGVPKELDSYSITMNTENDTRVLGGMVTVFAGTEPMRDGDYTVSAAGKKITVTFNRTLAEGTKYTVRLDGKLADVYGNQLTIPQTYSFTTEIGAYTIENFVLGQDGKSVSADITVNDEKTYPFTLVLAVEQNGILAEAKLGETRTLSKADGRQTLTVSLDTAPGDAKLRAMLWDSTESMKPYVASIPAD